MNNVDYVLAPALLVVLALLVLAFVIFQVRRLRTCRLNRAGRIGAYLGLALLALFTSCVALSSAINALRIHSFWAKHPAPGQLFDVDGHLMHIDCTGIGEPTIILDAGLGNEAIHWANVQAILSRTNRVCSYDRAGFGWSAPATSPRDADHIAEELHMLLADAGIHGPLVLVGHSIAGLYIRDFTSHYPNEVAGLVFVDATTPLQEQDPVYKRTVTKSPPDWLLHAAMIAGVPRLIHMCSPRMPHPSDLQKMQSEAYCRLHYSSISREVGNLTLSGQETVATGPFKVPVLILSHDPNQILGSHPSANDLARQNLWSRNQVEMEKLSPISQRIIVLGTTHSLISERPDLIAQFVEDFLKKVATPDQPLHSRGATITR